MVDEQQLRENIEKIFEILNTGDFSDASDVMTDDYTYRSTSGEQIQGLDGLEDFWNRYNEAFDDFRFELQDVFLDVDNNKGVVLYLQSGTHTGELQGIEPSNNDMEVLISSIGTFDDDGRLVDVFDVVDTLDLMRQLDALPEGVGQLDETRPGV